MMDIHEHALQMQQIVENLEEAFFLWDLRAQALLYISPQAETLFAASRPALHENLLAYLDSVHPEDRAAVKASYEKMLHGEHGEVVFRMADAEGRPRLVRGRTYPIYDADGVLYRMLGALEDITELHEIERQLRRHELLSTTLQQEKTQLELKNRFMSLVAHEIRTPLASIQLAAEMLGLRGDMMQSDVRRRHTDRIQNQIERLTRLLDEVLMISRAQELKLEFNPHLMDIRHLCAEIVEEFNEADGSHHVVFTVHGQPVMIAADERLLRQALNNLISNAIKYSPGQKTVNLRLIYTPTEVLIEVEDQGIGIPEADQPALFEVFQRGTNVGNIPGTGLGLVIAKQAVRLHGGKISFESQAGHGTTFTIRLPLPTLSK